MNILFIDSDRSWRNTLKHTLHNNSDKYKFIAVENIESAINHIYNSEYNFLIILELFSSYEKEDKAIIFLESLQKKLPSYAKLILTSKPFALGNLLDFTQKYPKCAVDGIFLKDTFEDEELISKINYLIERHTSLEQHSVEEKNFFKINYLNEDEGLDGVDIKNSTSENIIPVLFLSANPENTKPLNLKEEFIAISTILQSDNDFNLCSEWGIKSFQNPILHHKPKVIHFSGHGQLGSEELEIELGVEGLAITEGIILENEEIIQKEILGGLFELLIKDINIDLVFLNACHSVNLATEINKYIPFVISMTNTIDDNSAIKFSTTFYSRLIEKYDIQRAFKYAELEIEEITTSPDRKNIPKLHIKGKNND